MLIKRSVAVTVLLSLLQLTVVSASYAHYPGINGAAITQQISALEWGFRTGYSDGYQAGYSDYSQRAKSGGKSGRGDYGTKEEYKRGDRAYKPAYGSPDEYRDGYQQGYETGYRSGYERRTFDSSVPPGLARRGAGSVTNPASSGNKPTVKTNRAQQIPANTVMRVELLTNISTDGSQRGDRVQVRVLEPREFENAVIDGRVAYVTRPGKVRGRAELQLAFEQIRLSDGRWARVNAQVIEVVRTNDGSIEDVDPEGGVRGRDSTKGDVAKIGTGAAIGAIIGAIAGGGKGAAIGAAIGGAAGSGGVLTSRGRDIRLERGQQLRIRTSTDAHIE